MIRRDYEKLFSKLLPPEPPETLLDNIMARISKERQLRSIKRRFIIFSVAILCSAVTSFLAMMSFQESLAQTGFSQYFSLIFSDFGSIIPYWQDFGFAVLESLPTENMSILFITILVFLWSFKHFIKSAIHISSFRHSHD